MSKADSEGNLYFQASSDEVHVLYSLCEHVHASVGTNAGYLYTKCTGTFIETKHLC